jgi:hypothetical protein
VDDDHVIKIFEPKRTYVQEKVLDLLHVPHSVYTQES